MTSGGDRRRGKQCRPTVVHSFRRFHVRQNGASADNELLVVELSVEFGRQQLFIANLHEASSTCFVLACGLRSN
jgi:hypothetical protein